MSKATQDIVNFSKAQSYSKSRMDGNSDFLTVRTFYDIFSSLDNPVDSFI